MSDFQSFRDAVLEDEDLQERVISIVNTATANGAGLEENIVTLAKNHGYTVTEDDVTQHADFLGQDGDLTDFELEMISGGMRGKHEQRAGC
jgi:predicted ribosomally synthesized peptide with nif11-like leader